MNLLERKKLQKNIKGIINTNQDFNVFLGALTESDFLDTDVKNNLHLLQQHLDNMTVIFNGMSDNVRKHK